MIDHNTVKSNIESSTQWSKGAPLTCVLNIKSVFAIM